MIEVFNRSNRMRIFDDDDDNDIVYVQSAVCRGVARNYNRL